MDRVFKEEVGKLAEVKSGVFEKIEKNGVQVTPTVAQALNSFNMFLDTAYLWMEQLNYFANVGGTGECPEVPGGDEDEG